MNLREIKLSVFAKLVAIATIVILLLTQTPVWQYVSSGLKPILTAFVIAYLLDYFVRFFERRIKLHRALAIFLSITLFISMVSLLGVVVIPSIIDAVSSLIKSISSINMDMDVDFSFIQSIDFENVYLKQLQQSIIDTVAPILQKLTNITGTVFLMIVSEIQKITSGLI